MRGEKFHSSLEMVKKHLRISPRYIIANFGMLSPLDKTSKSGHHDFSQRRKITQKLKK